MLGDDESARLLGQTLEEEKETDQKLTDLAAGINVEASEEGEAEQEEPVEHTKSKSATCRTRTA